jgi:uncharacterized membrane protein
MKTSFAGTDPKMLRLWSGFGWATHGLFLVAVYFLYRFLRGYDVPPPLGSASDLAVDVALALQFAVLHSWLLLPSVRAWLTRWIPSPGYGVFYCFATCLSLGLVIGAWRPCGNVVWNLTGFERTTVLLCFFAGWVALFYSLSLTGLGYQTGWTTWRLWMRGQPIPRRGFEPRGAYAVLRHPVYLSFLSLIWFTPVMTYDRAVLVAVWTVYIFIGSYLKDRRLLHYMGDAYRRYQARVPGYPGFVVGPLARVPWTTSGDASAA